MSVRGRLAIDREAALLNPEFTTNVNFWDLIPFGVGVPQWVNVSGGDLYFGGSSGTGGGKARQTVLTKAGHTYNITFTANTNGGGGGTSAMQINVYDSATHALLATMNTLASAFGVTPNFTTLGPIVIEAVDSSTGDMASRDTYTQFIRLNEV